MVDESGSMVQLLGVPPSGGWDVSNDPSSKKPKLVVVRFDWLRSILGGYSGETAPPKAGTPTCVARNTKPV